MRTRMHAVKNNDDDNNNNNKGRLRLISNYVLSDRHFHP